MRRRLRDSSVARAVYVQRTHKPATGAGAGARSSGGAAASAAAAPSPAPAPVPAHGLASVVKTLRGTGGTVTGISDMEVEITGARTFPTLGVPSVKPTPGVWMYEVEIIAPGTVLSCLVPRTGSLTAVHAPLNRFARARPARFRQAYSTWGVIWRPGCWRCDAFVGVRRVAAHAICVGEHQDVWESCVALWGCGRRHCDLPAPWRIRGRVRRVSGAV